MKCLDHLDRKTKSAANISQDMNCCHIRLWMDKAFSKRIYFMNSIGNIAQDCRNPYYVIVSVADRQDREFDRNPSSVLTLRWNSERIPVTILCLACTHRLRIAVPMTRTEFFGNDDVEGLSDHLCFGESEDPLGSAVPESDQPIPVRINYPIGGIIRQSSR